MYFCLLAAAGMAHIVWYGQLPHEWYLVAPFVIGCWLLARAIAQRSPQRVLVIAERVLWYAVAFSSAAAYGTWRLETLVAEQLPSKMDKQGVIASFVIESIHQSSDTRTHFAATIVSAQRMDSNSEMAFVQSVSLCCAGRENSDPSQGSSQAAKPEREIKDYSLVGKRVRLAWYSPPSLAVGQQWQATLMLRRPRGLANPGGFDYGAWLLAQGFQATGYVSDKEARAMGYRQPSTLVRLRQHLQRGIGRDPNGEAGQFFEALLIGQRGGLSPDDWQILQATGTVHLMAISGLHVGLVAGLGFWLGALLARTLILSLKQSSSWWFRLVPPVFAVSLALSYSALAGFSIPTQRALIAVVLINLGWCLGVKLSRWTLLAFAVLLVSLSEPLLWLQAGFWLSFAAVAILLSQFDGIVGQQLKRSPRENIKNGFKLAAEMQWLLAFGMCLPLWLLGLPVSLLSPLANLLAVPLVALVFVPCLLLWVPLSFTPAGAVFLAGLSWLFEQFWSLLTWFAHVPAAVVWPSAPLQGLGLAVGLIASLMLVLPKSISIRLGAFSLLALVLLGGRSPQSKFELDVLDVGQGLAVVVKQPQNTLLYDTGASFSERFNAGAHIIQPYLRARGKVANFAVMVSHADADHSGGAAPIFAQFLPSEVWFGEYFDALPHYAEPCHQGQEWQWGEVNYRVLWPSKMAVEPNLNADVLTSPPSTEVASTSPTTQADTFQGNNRSCVLLIEIADVRFLLTGDIEKGVEQQLVDRGLLEAVDVLIAPHHGSKTSSSPAFLAALSPQQIIVSAGYKNRYGHPHVKVLERYAKLGAKVWNTGDQGAIRMSVVNGQLSIHAQRELAPKIWY
jgi:competence protein ComEC